MSAKPRAFKNQGSARIIEKEETNLVECSSSNLALFLLYLSTRSNLPHSLMHFFICFFVVVINMCFLSNIYAPMDAARK